MIISDGDLIKAVASIPLFPLTGVGCRSILPQYMVTSLSAIGSIKRGGRYNIKNLFEALYLAENSFVAGLEVESLISTSDGYIIGNPRTPTRVNLSVQYGLANVLDVFDNVHWELLQTNIQELAGPWIPFTYQANYAPTQRLGKVAFDSEKVSAIKVPCARDPRYYNIVIFPDRLTTSEYVRVYDPSDNIIASIP